MGNYNFCDALLEQELVEIPSFYKFITPVFFDRYNIKSPLNDIIMQFKERARVKVKTRTTMCRYIFHFARHISVINLRWDQGREEAAAVNLFLVDRNRFLSNSKLRTCLLHLIKLVSSAIWRGRSRRLDDADGPIDYIGFHQIRSILLSTERVGGSQFAGADQVLRIFFDNSLGELYG